MSTSRRALLPCTAVVAADPSGEVLSIFYPMWNEEVYIDRALDAARRVCERMVRDEVIADYELIVVDDASTDRTPELADMAAAVDPHVRVVHH